MIQLFPFLSQSHRWLNAAGENHRTVQICANKNLVSNVSTNKKSFYIFGGFPIETIWYFTCPTSVPHLLWGGFAPRNWEFSDMNSLNSPPSFFQFQWERYSSSCFCIITSGLESHSCLCSLGKLSVPLSTTSCPFLLHASLHEHINSESFPYYSHTNNPLVPSCNECPFFPSPSPKMLQRLLFCCPYSFISTS